MARLSVDKKSVYDIFNGTRNTSFLVPYYQRVYAWNEVQCEQLYDDLIRFAYDYDSSVKYDEYFLGSIVIFKNTNGYMEIIDGQQRLMSLFLLLRAFYTVLDSLCDGSNHNVQRMMELVGSCIWFTDDLGNFRDKSDFKIVSCVMMDSDLIDFKSIIETGECENYEILKRKRKISSYRKNYSFFMNKICNDFLDDIEQHVDLFCKCINVIIKNVILLPIDTESQDDALRIFATLNDRGKPLHDSDIFKAQMYSYWMSKGSIDAFLEKWSYMEDICKNTRSFSDVARVYYMDELFNKVCYFDRARYGDVMGVTNKSARTYYSQKNFELLKNDDMLQNMLLTVEFWKNVDDQNTDVFSDEVLKRFFVLHQYFSGIWMYVVNVYFLHFNVNGQLDNSEFCLFLDKIIAYYIVISILQRPSPYQRPEIFGMMKNIVFGQSAVFKNGCFNKTEFVKKFENFRFGSNSRITRVLLAWWCYQDKNQVLLSYNQSFQIEHIYPKARYDRHINELSDKSVLEYIGNKSFLEKRINIKASDNTWSDKVAYYIGSVNNGEKTKIHELLDLSHVYSNFGENEIRNRTIKIQNSFIDFVDRNGLFICIIFWYLCF